MTMTGLDWTILAVCVAALSWFSLRTVKHMRSVADFLSANRTAGRYMLALDASIAGIGAISAVALFEQYYAAGFPTIWWTWMTIPGAMIITLTGWVYYRFRETRCLTLAQFFEVRYSRRFRIFAGAIVWISGLLNFGIFPYVASNFFVYFCGLPEHFALLGMTVPTYWPIMILTTGMALLYATLGGQVTVMITDCVQGMFVTCGLVLLIVFLLSQFGWSEIVQSMTEAPVQATRDKLMRDAGLKKLAWEEAEKEGKRDVAEERKAEYDALTATARDDAKVRNEARGKSMLNPFDTGRVAHFSVFFYLILIFSMFYGGFSWQGQSGYKSAALSPHEQKMGQIIFNFLYMIRLAGLVLLAVCALTFLTHPRFAAASAPARRILETLKTGEVPQLAVQQRVPIALSYMLPAGLRGFFCVMMVFLLITTQNTYIHSWGSIFIQDVVLPLRKRPLSPEGHVKALRWSITGVVAFSILFAAFYKPTEFVQMYFAITGAVVGGLGAAIVGGLYWRRGATLGAYVAVGLGAALSVARIVFKQYTAQIAAIPEKGALLRGIHYLNTEVTSQVIWFWIMILCLASYVVLSLIGRRQPYNLDRMLHRGKYDIKGEHKQASDGMHRVWLKIVGVTEEFSRADRVLAIAMVAYNLTWVALFFGALAVNFLIQPIADEWWTLFWRIWIYMQVLIGIPVAVWFVIGGVKDIRQVFHRLTTMERDEADDGRVIGHHLANEDATVAAEESEDS